MAELVAAVELEKATEEENVVGSVLSDHANLVPVAVDQGVTTAMFGQPDCRLMWCAAVVGRELPLARVLCLIRDGIRAERCWEQWSDEQLVTFALSWPASPTAVRANVRRLVTLYRRWGSAEDQLRRLRDTLAGDASPDLATGLKRIRRPSFTVLPNRSRGAA